MDPLFRLSKWYTYFSIGNNNIDGSGSAMTSGRNIMLNW